MRLVQHRHLLQAVGADGVDLAGLDLIEEHVLQPRKAVQLVPDVDQHIAHLFEGEGLYLLRRLGFPGIEALSEAVQHIHQAAQLVRHLVAEVIPGLIQDFLAGIHFFNEGADHAAQVDPAAEVNGQSGGLQLHGIGLELQAHQHRDGQAGAADHAHRAAVLPGGADAREDHVAEVLPDPLHRFGIGDGTHGRGVGFALGPIIHKRLSAL